MTDKNKEIKIKEYADGSGAKIDIYSPDSRTKPHDSVHIKVNTDNKTYDAISKINGDKEESSGGCYLTSACISHFQEKFDDSCYELSVLRWFRNKFVSKEDIEHYYQIAPILVEAINNNSECDDIYKDIYENTICFCVKAIEQENYVLAYDTYKNSILNLEETYVKPVIQQNVVKVLRK